VPVEQLTVIDDVASVFDVVPVVMPLNVIFPALIEQVDDTCTITSKLVLLLFAAAEKDNISAPVSAAVFRIKEKCFIRASWRLNNGMLSSRTPDFFGVTSQQAHGPLVVPPCPVRQLNSVRRSYRLLAYSSGR
jgi:hypothetical protein